VKLRARWIGPAPRVGDYLMSPTRPRFAYRVRTVNPTSPNVTWDPAHKAEVRRLAIDVDRVAVAEVAASSRVHAWRWDKRGPKRVASV
jgi:hypothetical protein